MRTYPDCIPCLLNQALKALKLCYTDDAEIFAALKQISNHFADFETKQSPPEMAMKVHRLVREITATHDPYFTMKQLAINEVLRHENRIREVINAAQNPIRAALRFAIAGNVLDFAILDGPPKYLDVQLDSAIYNNVNENGLDALELAIKSADTIMLIGDNAGESVLDKLLIEQMHGKRVIYAVRGSPTINDVTMADAIASSLDNVAELVDNGSDAPGTLLANVSPAFMKYFNAADLIIAKGQGNYESLSDCEKRIFFMTQIKCPVIARDLDSTVGDWLVTTSKRGVSKR